MLKKWSACVLGEEWTRWIDDRWRSEEVRRKVGLRLKLNDTLVWKVLSGSDMWSAWVKSGWLKECTSLRWNVEISRDRGRPCTCGLDEVKKVYNARSRELSDAKVVCMDREQLTEDGLCLTTNMMESHAWCLQKLRDSCTVCVKKCFHVCWEGAGVVTFRSLTAYTQRWEKRLSIKKFVEIRSIFFLLKIS